MRTIGLRERVEYVLANAPVLDKQPSLNDGLEFYRNKPHTMPIHLSPNYPPDSQNEISVRANSAHVLHDIFEIYEDASKSKLSEKFKEYAVQHEGEHFNAAQQLGAFSGRFGIRIYHLSTPSQKDNQLYLQPYVKIDNLRTTKLGAALISACPSQPSRNDQLAYQRLGYSSIDEIARAALCHNRAHPDKYPVPHSVDQDFIEKLALEGFCN